METDFLLVTCGFRVLTLIRRECVDLAQCVPLIPTESAAANCKLLDTHICLNPDFMGECVTLRRVRNVFEQIILQEIACGKEEHTGWGGVEIIQVRSLSASS